MKNLPIKLQLLDKDIEIPNYTHMGDAGLDLRSTIDLILEPKQRATIPCGIALSIPEGYAGLVVPRSGLAAKHGISIVNAPGLIDSNYRGEICAILHNTDCKIPFQIHRGDRIAQLVIISVPNVLIQVVDSLDQTLRGNAGFGSSGLI